jgi:uncharacterized membrane protein YfcA
VPTLIVLTVIGFFAQLVDGALGMAYGATSSTLVLAAGYSPVVASASVHLAELGTTLASGASHWRFGNVDWRTVRRIGIPGAIGAFAGAVLLGNISGDIAKPWMAGILLALGVYILLRFTLAGVPQREGRRYVRGRYLVPLGLAGGFVDATGGGGWGPVATPTLLSTGRMEPRKVVGSVDTSEFLVALAASAGFLVALVGGLIVLTNLRTIFTVTPEPGDARAAAYAIIVLLWIAAILLVVRTHRRTGEPLLNRREAREAALEGA